VRGRRRSSKLNEDPVYYEMKSRSKGKANDEEAIYVEMATLKGANKPQPPNEYKEECLLRLRIQVRLTTKQPLIYISL